MQMDIGLDTGDMLAMRSMPIQAEDTAASLHDKLAKCGAELLLETLHQLPTYQAQRQSQPVEGVTYAEKIRKEEAQIKWDQSAEIVFRQIRAFNPYPGAYTEYEGQTLKVWQAYVSSENGPPGKILNVDKTGMTIACQEGSITVTRLQKAGGKMLTVAEFIAGFTLQTGHFFT